MKKPSRRARTLLSLVAPVFSLSLEACAVPADECSKKGEDGTYTIDLSCHEEKAGVGDTGTPDSATHTGETDSDSGTHTGDSDTDTDDTGPVPVDDDDDGYSEDVDCDDANSAIHPGAVESCDSLDNDCDGSVDEAGSTGESTYYADTDGDGYGDASASLASCDSVPGYVEDATDCDDANSAIHPYAEESCHATEDANCDGSFGAGVDADGDGAQACDDCDDTEALAFPGNPEVCDEIDNDCEGSTDVDATDALTWHADTDTDGFGDPINTTLACDAPSGYVSDDTDCDDTASTVNPGETEVCDGIDNDCSGGADDGLPRNTFYLDADTDGFGDPATSTDSCESTLTGYTTDLTDCDDTDSAVNPAASEVCDGVDNDCDDELDEDSSLDAAEWYADADTDGYGETGSGRIACAAEAGESGIDGDCDDGDDGVYPGATEVCDGIDNDCDGSSDESGATGETAWYPDSDIDGYGDMHSSPTTACEPPSNHVEDATDCDDADDGIYPGASEILSDGIDQDCDGADDLVADADSDGDPDATDCDDADPDAFTGNPEVCDGVDNDCDGNADDSATDALTWYIDNDRDGYGGTTWTLSCTEPSGYTALSGDCDDLDNDAYPGNVEWCDGVDNDCSGGVDDGDYDGDSFDVCDECDDADSAVNPAATEICNGMDDDCDDDIDEGVGTTYYLDEDGDGYGDDASASVECSDPGGDYITVGDDCDDTPVFGLDLNPMESQECYSALDEDCDGDVAFDDSDCNVATTDNLFQDSASSNGEDPLGVASTGGWVTSSGLSVTTTCASANAGGCSLEFTGPGTWYVVSDDAATVGSMYCMFSAESDDSSTIITYSFGSSGWQSYEASSIGWGHAVLGPFSQTSSGVVSFVVSTTEADTFRIDSVACQQ